MVGARHRLAHRRGDWMDGDQLACHSGSYLLSISISAIWTVITGSAAGLLTVLAGRDSSIPANPKQESEAGPVARILSKAASVAAVIFVAVLLIFIAQTLTTVMHYIGDARHWSWNLAGKSACSAERSLIST